MEKESYDQLLITIHAWRTRFDKLGVGGIIEPLLDILAPLAPIGAQLIYIAQPVAGFWIKDDTLQRWAGLLESPDGMDWLRHNLTGQEDERD